MSLPSATLVDVVRTRVEERPWLEVYRFLADGETEGDRLSLEELDLRARAIAARLQESGSKGDRALLLYAPGLDFITSFLGCLYAGVVAVPTYPPRFNRPQPRLKAILDDSDPQWILTSAAIADRREKLELHTPELGGRRFVVTDHAEDETAGASAGDASLETLAARWQPPSIDADSLAFLQYTSGSTSTPKGVMVSHGNLVHNEAMIQRAFGQDESSVVVSWLPLYHDMGLIGGVLQPLFLGARCVLMSPHSFLQKPARWLQAISRYRATTSGGPNFAYDLCARRVAEEDRAGLDLSCWRVAFNGAEPVRAETLASFAETFAPSGFDRKAFYPCYGLAEGTLFVTGGGVEREPVVASFDAESLLEHRPRSAEDGRALVSSGLPWLDQRLEIVDPETRRPLGPAEVGEIWVAGPSVAGGYWQRPEQSAEDFGARLADEPEAGPFLRTGDLGFVDSAGELFVTGRSKDLIIIRGQNHYPQDLELTAERAHPALRADGGAAFTLDAATLDAATFDAATFDTGDEKLVVVQELERRREGEADEALEAVRQAVTGAHEVAVYDVVLIRAGTLPKTTSGKVRRRGTRQAYLAGELTVIARAALDRPEPVDEVGAHEAADAGQPAAKIPLDRELLLALPAGERRPRLVAFLRHEVARSLAAAPAAVDPERPLTQLGLDSLAAVELQHTAETSFGVPIELAELLDGCSLAELADRVDSALDEASAEDPGRRGPKLVAGPVRETHELSYGQRALWFLHRLAPDSGAYNVAVAVRMRWALDTAALERALLRVVERHPALRTTFHEEDGEPYQRIHEAPRIDFRVGTADGRSDEALAEHLEATALRPFDLEQGPLLRFEVLRLGAEDFVVSMVVHHTVSDFWSMAVLARELGALYRQESEGVEAGLDPLPVEYGDFVRWQSDLLDSPRGDELWGYWRQQLEGAPPRLELPTDRPRPAVQSFRGADVTSTLDPELAAGVTALAARSGTTAYTVLLTAFVALLHRYSGLDDLVVGSPTAGRSSSELSGVIGYFVDPVALRGDLSGRPSGAELLARMRGTVLGAFEHHDFPFPLLAERLHPERDPSYSPVFQAMFAYQGAPRPEEQDLAALTVGAAGVEMQIGGLHFESLPIAERVAQFDLTLVLARVGGRLRALVEYSTDLFDASTLRRFLDHYANLLGALVGSPGEPVADLPLLGPAERVQILGEWAGLASPADDGVLHRAILERVQQSPDAIALQDDAGRRPGREEDETKTVTWAELARRSARLAIELKRHGVGPEVPVAVLLPRSVDTVVALLAVLRAGGCYLPIDPRSPARRIGFQLADSAAAVLLTSASQDDELVSSLEVPADTRVLTLDSVEDGGPSLPGESDPFGTVVGEEEVAGDHAAYVIYTSGSTGRPKGVVVSHRQALDHCRSFVRRCRLGPEDRVLFFGSPSFDPALEQTFSCLLGGARLVLRGEALWAPRDFPAHVEALGLTVADLPVAYWQEILNEAPAAPRPESLRLVLVGGEVMPSSAVRAYPGSALGSAVLWNIYGPTEAVISATVHDVGPGDGNRARVPIGRPLDHRQVYVLDGGLEPVPAGVVGELYLGGRLARGYLGRPGLTAERFVPHPFADRPGQRLYRSGDLVRFLSDGALDFLGRHDHQVKVRGFRIELGEIEAALETLAEVRSAVVLLLDDRGPGGDLLAAFVEPAAGLLPPDDLEASGRLSDRLRDALARALPDYMQPTAYKILAVLPRTASGKVDRQALPVEEVSRESPERAWVAPRSPVERNLAHIWSELLGQERVGVHASFFALGGHSLLATRAMSRVRQVFGVDLPLQTLFEAPTVAAFAQRLEALRQSEREALPPLVPQPREGGIPASFAQERLWFLDQLQPESPFYNIPAAFRLRGPLVEDVFFRAVAEIVRRQEALRTRFVTAEGRPWQVIGRLAGVDLPVVDLSPLAPEVREATLGELARREARRPFVLEKGPLWRFTVLRLAEDDRVVLLTMHHIISDGWSLGVFVHELSMLYGAFLDHRPSPLDEPPVQFADYALWQRQWLRDELLERQLSFWLDQLRGAPPILELPTDRPRPAVQRHRGASLRFAIAAPQRQGLAALAKEEDATLFMGALAVFYTLLGRLAGHHDLVVGSPISNRDRVEIEGLIGFFVNALVLRQDLSGDPTFRQLLGRVRRTALAAYAHPDVPFERLVAELHPERDLGHSPIFQVVFALDDAAFEPSRMTAIELEPMPLETGTSKFDLTLLFENTEHGLEGYLEFNSDLFDTPTAGRFVEHFRALMTAVAENPDQNLSHLSMLTPVEREMLRVEWTATTTGYPRHQTLPELFDEQVRRHGDAIALVSVASGETVSYRELARRARRLARYLVRHGVGPEVPVGLCFERSVELIVAILAVLEAGGTFVPLDPTYPRQRLAQMLEDLGAPWILGRADQLELLPPASAGEEERRLDFDRAEGELTAESMAAESMAAESMAAESMAGDADEPPLAIPGDAGQLAYVMYTSGSTGRPKGVAVSHRSVTRLVRDTSYMSFGPREVFLQFAPAAFDASTLEIWGPLLNGGRLVVMSPGQPSLEELGGALARFGVTTLWLTAGLFHQMVEHHLEQLRPVRQLLAGGDVLSVPHVRKVLESLPGIRLINGYGPTENTTFTCCHPMTHPGDVGTSVSIGRPIANTRVFIVDSHGELCPIGVPGELLIAGDGLARGYLSRPAFTAERFVPNAFDEPGERLYRTGDMARWMGNGNIEFLGRIDQQVKVRGYRIELEEIEAALTGHPAVRSCAAVARPMAGDKQLVACVVPAAGHAMPSTSELRDYLLERLPRFMVPTLFEVVGELPLSPTGKVDRRALASASASAMLPSADRTAPRNPTEELLTRLWGELLERREPIGVHEDFFEIGGHSLLATQLVSRVRDLFAVELALHQVFELPTVAGLAQIIQGTRRATDDVVVEPIARRSAPGDAPLSFAQERLWFLDQLEGANPAYNIVAALRLRGALDFAALALALESVVERHEALRTTFYAVAGEPRQRLAPIGPDRDPRAELPTVELAHLALPSRRIEVKRLVRAEAERAFELATGPLFRRRLLRLGEHDHVLLLNLHHIVGDGWSVGVLSREVSASYESLVFGRAPELEPLPIQYADYAAWQRQMVDDVFADDLSYWRQQLTDAPTGLDLPTDRPRPAQQTFDGRQRPFHLKKESFAALGRLAKATDSTPYMVLLAVFGVLLARWSGARELMVGSPVANRQRSELEGLIGFFVNTLVLRQDLSGRPTFRELLARVRETTLAAYAHQAVPFERVVAEVDPERALGHNPLFQVMLAYQNNALVPPTIGDLGVELLEIDGRSAKFDLTLSLSEELEGLAGFLEYNRDLFDPTTIARFDKQLRRLLAEVVERPDTPIEDLPLLDTVQHHQLLVEWCSVTPSAGTEQCLHHMVAEQALRTPDAPAVRDGESTLAYRQLLARVVGLATQLGGLGVGPEVRVGVLLERDVDLVTTLLAVLAAGGTYVGLDPAYPAERLAFMVEDSQAHTVLTRGELAPLLGDDVPSIVLDTLCTGDADLDTAHDATVDDEALARQARQVLESPARCDNLAYLIYTSGSTGRPKGVAIAHRSAVERVLWARRQYGDHELAGVLAATSICFDLSVWELFVPLAWGGTVIVARDALDLAGHPARDAVTLINTVPSALAELLRLEAVPEGVVTVNLAGEPFQQVLVEKLFDETGAERLYNLYGPSEDTTYSTGATIRAGAERPPAIGRPLDGTRAYLLDAAGQPTPIGVPGELHLGGAGLSRGYLGRPALTAERYVPDPFASTPGSRLYRTGDRVRWRTDGLLDFLGRFDHQVKVRGFRIELGEIESRLLAHPEIHEALVAVRGEGAEARLVAWAAPDRVDPAELRSFLGEKLPEYMVPSHLVLLEALPRLPNGKVARAELPEPERVAATSSETPRSPVEEVVAEAFAMVLGIGPVGVHDDFFALGGHSLLATRVISQIRRALGIDLPLRALFEAPTVARLAARVASARRDGGVEAPPITAGRRPEHILLSFSQQRQWLLDQLDPGDPGFNIPAAYQVDGPVDAEALEAALATVVARHESLRTVFGAHEGTPYQVVLPTLEVELPQIDLRDEAPGERAEVLAGLLREEADHSFDLARGPLFRMVLFRLEETRHVVAVNLHHIVSDGWSMGIFVRELARAYEAHHRGREPELPALAVQYPDYALWQREWLAGEALERGLEYWRRQLADAPSQLELPTDRPRPALRSSEGGQARVVLPTEAVDALRAVARARGGTLYMVLVAVLDVLLWRLTGQRDLSLGSYIANRQRGETEGLIGFFVNTLVMRAVLEPDEPFAALVGRLREVVLDAYAHQEIPFEKVLDAVQPVRDPSITPLFQVMAVLQNTPGEAPRLGGTELRELDPEERPVHYDLTFWMTEEQGGLRIDCHYARALFDPATIERLLGRFERLATAAADQPDLPVGRLSYLAPAERHLLLGEWSGRLARLARLETRRRGPAVHRQIACQASRTPERPALIFDGSVITYADLASRVRRRAHRLHVLGAGPEVPVAICLGRSPELVVSLLAVLEAGSHYLPLDPAYPAERLAFMVRDSGARILVGERGSQAALPEVEHVLWVGEDEEIVVEPARLPEPDADSLAYTIYTSGSTGRPKGTLVSHGALTHFVAAATEVYGIDAEDRVLQFASVSFDTSAEEIYPVLARGGALVLRPDAVETPAALLERCRREGVTVLDLPTAYWHELCRWLEEEGGELPPGIRLVILGGEAAQKPQLEIWWRRAGREIRLANSYGPTEATVVASLAELSTWQPPSADARIAIGRPLPGVELWVVDRRLELVSPGSAGELALAGEGLARGYLDRPSATAEVFVPHPWAEGERLYRTGDRVRFRSDGELEFLGRIDHQVKVRGFRIELREIEQALLALDGVADAVVVTRRGERGENRLVAYVVGPAQSTGAERLRAELRRRLPDYMVPSLFVRLGALPKTPSGKIDRRALPAPPEDEGGPLSTGEAGAARDEREAILARLWSEVLRRSEVGIHDNFFELGGDSILGIQIVSRAHQKGLQLTPQQLFHHQTIAELAAVAVDVTATATGVEAEQGTVEGEAPLTPYQAWFFDDLSPEDPEHWNIALMLELRRAWPPAVIEAAVGDLLAHHDGLRMRFEPGPSDGGPRHGRRQYNAGLGDAVPFASYDLSGLPPARRFEALETLAGEAQASLDLERGPMLRVLRFELGDDEPPRLLLALHHMVVDVISWHVLLEDLGLACEARARGEAPVLPPKTTSYLEWSRRLAEHAGSPELLAEAAYWLRPLPEDLAVLPADHPLGENLEGSTETELTLLSEDETRALLQEVPKTYNTQINDVLLAALLLAFTRRYGGRALRIDLEGHGREDILEGIDLSRTVGCFTALFPVVLELPGEDGPGEVLKRVKEDLRAIPRHGVGYGVLRYLGDDPARTEALKEIPPAEASFNYVGQLDQGLPDSAPFALATEDTGPIRSPRAARGNTLEILAGVNEGRLRVRWTYSRNLHRHASVEALAESFAAALRELVEHCQDPEAASYTPSDFELAGLSQDDLDTIMGEVEGLLD